MQSFSEKAYSNRILKLFFAKDLSKYSYLRMCAEVYYTAAVCQAAVPQREIQRGPAFKQLILPGCEFQGGGGYICFVHHCSHITAHCSLIEKWVSRGERLL